MGWIKQKLLKVITLVEEIAQTEWKDDHWVAGIHGKEGTFQETQMVELECYYCDTALGQTKKAEG